jgi:hypothetical protein
MFQQLNQAVGMAPTGEGLLNQASYYGANLLGGMPGAGDPRSMMNPAAQQRLDAEQAHAKEQAAQQAMSTIDYNNPDSIEKVAQQLAQLGRVDEANQLMTRASALRAKDAAVLEAGQEGIMAEAARKRTQQQKFQAMQMAKRSGDADLVSQIQNGTLSPEAYLAHRMQKKELFELSRGEMLTDKEGNIIRVNPYSDGKAADKGGRYEHSVAEYKSWDEGTQRARESEARANKYVGVVDKLQSTPMKAGFEGTAEEWVLRQLGKRDEPNYLRTEVVGIKNHEAIELLPPGVASDRDIEIVMRGVPPDNASNEEMIRWVQAAAEAQKIIAEWEDMRAEYIITGRAAEFQDAWKEHIGKQEYAAKVKNTPPEAIEYLQTNPQFVDSFVAKYGWNPLEAQ